MTARFELVGVLAMQTYYHHHLDMYLIRLGIFRACRKGGSLVQQKSLLTWSLSPTSKFGLQVHGRYVHDKTLLEKSITHLGRRTGNIYIYTYSNMSSYIRNCK